MFAKTNIKIENAPANKMSHLKLYCIDMGNTHTHCVSVDADLSKQDVFSCSNSKDYPTVGFSERLISEKLFESSGADAIAWCSVVPNEARKLQAALEKSPYESMRLTHENSPIKIDCSDPSQVGHDRIADAVGAGIFFEPPYLVIDMGTAVTIDLVDSNGAYAGGVIAPGMHAFASYLSERAAQLPKINPAEADYDLIIGKNTIEAMYVGCAKGFCKLADGIIADIEKKYFLRLNGARKKTIFTGGSISLLPKKWLADRRVESNLAQLGLAKSYLINKKQEL